MTTMAKTATAMPQRRPPKAMQRRSTAKKKASCTCPSRRSKPPACSWLPQARELGTAISFPGEIRFDEDRTAHVVPRVPGVVEAVHAELGQAVKRGQVLAVIASQQISDLRSEQQAAQRRLELARLTFQRENSCGRSASPPSRTTCRPARRCRRPRSPWPTPGRRSQRWGRPVPATAMNCARRSMRWWWKHLTVGEVVDETSNAFTLSDLSRVWATFAVAPRDLDKVVTGREVTVSAPDLGAQVEGKVNYVGSLLGEQNRAATVRATLANPRRLAPRAVRQCGCQRRALRGRRGGAGKRPANLEEQTVVFARTEEGFEARPVKTGRRDAGQVEITSGLAAGTQVAAAGSFVLKSELGKARPSTATDPGTPACSNA
jgi:cobalt-zinc-cadmium efflux system membrane fusion protein